MTPDAWRVRGGRGEGLHPQSVIKLVLGVACAIVALPGSWTVTVISVGSVFHLFHLLCSQPSAGGAWTHRRKLGASGAVAQKARKNTSSLGERKDAPETWVERRQQPTHGPGGSSRRGSPSGSEFGQAMQRAGNPLDPPEDRAGEVRLVSCSRAFGFWPTGGIPGIQASLGTWQKWIHREVEGLLRQRFA